MRKVRKDAPFSPIRFKSHGWDSLPSDFRRRWPDPKLRTRVSFELSRGLENLSEKSIFGLSFVSDRDKDGFILTIRKRLSQKKISVLLFFRQKVFLLFTEKRHKCLCRRKSDDAKVWRRCRHHRSDLSSKIDVGVVCVTLRFVWNKYWLMKVSHRSFPENKF